MNENPLRSIVIAGGGVAGWTAAIVAARELRNQPVTIRVVEDPDDPVPPLGIAALPSTQAFCESLGFEEPAVVRTTGATFRLGTRFVDWSGPGSDEIHPVGVHGASIEYLPFHQFATKMHLSGDRTPYGQYCLGAAAARAGRFAPTVNDPNSILSTMRYALNLDAKHYAAFLRAQALEFGVETVPGRIRSATLRGDGFIERVELEDGSGVSGDLFIDCTGPEAVLIERTLGVGYQSWADLLPGNRVAWVNTQADPALPTVSTITAEDPGWAHTIPLQQFTHELFVYDARWLTDDEAAARWPEHVRSSVRFEASRPGRRESFWTGNCVALGAAAGTVQPLDGAGLRLVESGIRRLMNLLPLADCSPLLADEYNRLTTLEYTSARDFQALHYQLARGRDSAFWDVPRKLPASLEHRMKLFGCHGQVAVYEEEIYPEAHWAAASILHGAWPDGYEPILDSYDIRALGDRFSRMREIIAATVPRLPTQAQFIAGNRLAGPA